MSDWKSARGRIGRVSAHHLPRGLAVRLAERDGTHDGQSLV